MVVKAKYEGWMRRSRIASAAHSSTVPPFGGLTSEVKCVGEGRIRKDGLKRVSSLALASAPSWTGVQHHRVKWRERDWRSWELKGGCIEDYLRCRLGTS